MTAVKTSPLPVIPKSVFATPLTGAPSLFSALLGSSMAPGVIDKNSVQSVLSAVFKIGVNYLMFYIFRTYWIVRV